MQIVERAITISLAEEGGRRSARASARRASAPL